jgi:hypothetical protein
MFTFSYLRHNGAKVSMLKGAKAPSTGSGSGNTGLSANAGTPRISVHGYRSLFLTLFGLTVFLSGVDLVSTAFALSQGFAEANSIMIAIGNFTGLGLIGALGLTKLVFLAGSGFVATLGIRTGNRTLRTRALIVLSFLAVMLFAVSMNNLYWITS